MKKLFTIIAAVTITTSVFAQAPQLMSYQAVIRDLSDNLVTNTNIGMQISVLQGSISGTPVYVERHFPTTNSNGLVTVEIANGTIISGVFSTIDWTNGPYFIKTETDLNGGATYTITGTSQLLSVPYALHANTADSVFATITETDPVFGASVAGGITTTDTTNWNNHTIDTDTQLDSTGVAALGYVAGIHINGTTNNVVKFTGATTGGNSQITDNGTNVGIGTTTPTFGLDVRNGLIGGSFDNPAGGNYTNANISINSTGPGQWPRISLAEQGDSATGLTIFAVANVGGGMEVITSGQSAWAPVFASGFTISSDRRMKNNLHKIIPAEYEGYMNQIRYIESATYFYNWKENREVPHIGVIAQTLPKGLQSRTSTLGGVNSEDRLGVSLADMTGLNLIGIKALDYKQSQLEKLVTSQQAMIEELLKRIKDLEKK